MSGAITGADATLYLTNLDQHQVKEDVRFLRRFGRFPAATSVLDVGFGSGALLEFLASEPGYGRRLAGIELSAELYEANEKHLRELGIQVVNGDFLSTDLLRNFNPNTIIMSFYLHHQVNPSSHIGCSASLAMPGTKLFVYDRILSSENARAGFLDFWDREYRVAHEWQEEIPNLLARDQLVRIASKHDYRLVEQQIAPHDNRLSVAEFPKTAFEFWYEPTGTEVIPCILIHPPFVAARPQILESLRCDGLLVTDEYKVRYSGDMVEAIYGGLPWTALLADWIRDDFNGAEGTLLFYSHADQSGSEVLAHLTRKKRHNRKKHGILEGPIDALSGNKALFRAYHVPEPWESAQFVERVMDFVV